MQNQEPPKNQINPFLEQDDDKPVSSSPPAPSPDSLQDPFEQLETPAEEPTNPPPIQTPTQAQIEPQPEAQSEPQPEPQPETTQSVSVQPGMPESEPQKKGLSLKGIIAIVIIVIAVFTTIYILLHQDIIRPLVDMIYGQETVDEIDNQMINDIKNTEPPKEEAIEPEEQTCPDDTLECPDGTEVNRILPDCEFAECPPMATEATSSDEEMTETEATDEETDEEEAECILEKGIISPNTILDGASTKCCPGLKLILENNNKFTKAYCMPCGNFICEEPENSNNCIEDCPKIIDKFTSIELETDTDGDGLIDAEEIWYGTDSKLADSDLDGYSDGAELLSAYNPAGTGVIKTDLNTPEGAILSHIYGLRECNKERIASMLHISEDFFANQILLKMITDGKNMDKAEIEEMLKEDFANQKAYANDIKEIKFSNRTPIGPQKVQLTYTIIYEPDENKYIPSKQEVIPLVKVGGKWMFDVLAMALQEVNPDSLDSEKQKSRDAKRVADIKLIQTGLELFFNDYDRYADSLSDSNLANYLLVPENPSYTDDLCKYNDRYKYTVKDDGDSYSLEYCLETGSGNLSAGKHMASPSGMTENYSIPKYIDCN